ncbi:MAG: cupin domain-containing protein [Actinomycetota bacterium]
MQRRRVVTGTSSEGKSVVVIDERVDPITIALNPGGAFERIWGGDEIVKLPTDGILPATTGWFPPAGGFRFAVVTFGPEQSMNDDFDMDSALVEMRDKVPGLLETLEQDNPIFHTTDTIDFNFIVDGEISLELDDGKEVLLRTGDCVVQNGARHAWHNRSGRPCVMAVALVGAHRAG